jgi:hypothetical protein
VLANGRAPELLLLLLLLEQKGIVTQSHSGAAAETVINQPGERYYDDD